MGAAQSSPYDLPASLSAKLQARRPTVLAFMSPQCGLCASLRPALEQIASSTGEASSNCGESTSGGAGGSGLQVAVVDAQQDKLWAPEMLAYDVQAVPCFVLLDPGGAAVCKTPAPHSRQQMEAALADMVEHAARLKAARR